MRTMSADWGAECDADPELAGAQRDEKGDDAVEAADGEQQRHHAEAARCSRDHPQRLVVLLEVIFECAHRKRGHLGINIRNRAADRIRQQRRRVVPVARDPTAASSAPGMISLTQSTS
ncbi:MAG: hypothetical protein WD690_14680 [Vicinamibacterales bacterium]